LIPLNRSSRHQKDGADRELATSDAGKCFGIQQRWPRFLQERPVFDYATMDPETTRGLEHFVAAIKTTFSDHARSVVLFGSGAEDRLRPVSDLNLIVVLAEFDLERAARFREQSTAVRAALQIRIMIILDREIGQAANFFSVKFADIARRHRVLWGNDPFAHIEIGRAAAIDDLREALFDLELRLRSQWIARGAAADQLRIVAAEAAGGMRACAAELLSLESKPASSPREALDIIAGAPLESLTKARTSSTIDAATTEALFRTIMRLAGEMRKRAERLT
jgi:predicted nucleotidyltransferase